MRKMGLDGSDTVPLRNLLLSMTEIGSKKPEIV